MSTFFYVLRDDTETQLLETLKERIKDKNVQVRVWAAKALAIFQDSSDPSDPVSTCLLKALNSDAAR